MRFRGTVVKGAEIGGKFAVATANLKVASRLKLPEGVYFIEARASGKTLEGLLHFGKRLTFGAGRTAEAHFLDFAGDLYGKTLEIHVLHRERDIEKFRNADALFTQIEKDITRARKFFLRREIKAQWKKVTAKGRAQMAEKAFLEIKKNPHFQKAKNVFLFAAMADEIPIEQIACPGLSGISSMISDKKCFFPRVEGAELRFYESTYKNLRKGTFGILEPAKKIPALPKASDIIFVPSVAVDKHGNRLGRGKGFYDRFLKKTDAHTVAVIPDFAYIKNIPAEAHDSGVNEVVVSR